MIKKFFLPIGITAAIYLNAQDVSTIRNTLEIYSNSSYIGSSKYNAMVGSTGALGGDFNALNINPAGIGVSITNEISGTLAIQSNKNITSFGSRSLDYTINKTDLSNVGGMMVFQIEDGSPWKFLNLAVNYSHQSIEDYSETPGNSNIKYSIYDQDNQLLTELTYAGHAYNRYGNLSKMSIGIGANYNNNLYFGAGLNFHNAVLDQYDSVGFTSSVDNATEVANKQYTPFSESSTGFSVSVGVIGKINPQFRLGAALETPTWWRIERIYTEYENPNDGVYQESRDLSSPMKATLSAAFVANKNFAINMDYSLGITKPRYKVYGPAETELNQFFSDHSKSLSEIKFGAEYRLNALRLRGGYAFASSPFNSMSIPTISDSGNIGNTSFNNLFVGKRNTLGMGIGYDFKFFFVDAAYQNVSSEYNSPFFRGSSAKNTGYFSDQYIIESDEFIVSHVKNKRNNFFITFGWKF
jgi:hypothetical protein